MAIRNSRMFRFVPSGCTDSVDGTEAPTGAMLQLADLVVAPGTNHLFVCRPAIFKLVDFTGLAYSSPGFVSSLLVVGNIAYGTIATALNTNRDEPYAVNLLTGAKITVSGITLANVPISPPTSGAWTPPIVAQIGSRIIVTHPGYSGTTTVIGWFDISGFSETTTADTHSTTTIDNIPSSALLGVQPGMTVTGSGIPAGDTVYSTSVSGATGSITLSAAATATATGVSITIAGGTPSAPLWGAGNVDRNPLPSVPVGVSLSNAGGAVYALGTNGLAFSDPGFPCRITNTPNSQYITTNDGLAITAVAPLMLSAPLVTTGIVQSVIAFKGTRGMLQITGDPSTSNLAANALPMATGTASPLSIAPCEIGTTFISPEGLRAIQFNGTVSEPVGDAGKGITQPFIYSAVPSRVTGAANAHTLRYSVSNGSQPNNPFQEWWFDIGRKVWTGPMSIVPSLIQPWTGTDAQNTFVITPRGVNASLWQSDPTPDLDSSYVEQGAAMQWTYQPAPLPDSGEMAMYSLAEMALAGSFNGTAATVDVTDIAGTPFQATIVPINPLPPPSLWDSAVWDTSTWDGGGTTFQQWPIYFPGQLVFKQLAPQISGPSSRSVALGNIYMRVQQLRYSLPVPRL